jgi:hypothetical protein
MRGGSPGVRQVRHLVARARQSASTAPPAEGMTPLCSAGRMCLCTPLAETLRIATGSSANRARAANALPRTSEDDDDDDGDDDVVGDVRNARAWSASSDTAPYSTRGEAAPGWCVQSCRMLMQRSEICGT